MSRLRFLAWKVWNRTRYYWPQAQSRKRAQQGFATYYASQGIAWKPKRPWWVP